MIKNKIYVTTMYRYGSRESHSYIVYAGFNKNEAIDIGNETKDYRGGKYDPEVVSFDPGIPKSREVVYGNIDNF